MKLTAKIWWNQATWQGDTASEETEFNLILSFRNSAGIEAGLLMRQHPENMICI